MTKRTEKIRDFILRSVNDNATGLATQIMNEFDISRQAANRHLRNLVAHGRITATGQTVNRRYAEIPLVEEAFDVSLHGLEEDIVWTTQIRPLLGEIKNNVLRISEYGFSEILNNAIEHSEGKKARLIIRKTYNSILFGIEDDGIGIFNKIQNDYGLELPEHSILELSKGKTTTDPTRHSGQGIFFTSKSFDLFSIRSGRLFFSQPGYGDESLMFLMSEDYINEDIQGTIVYFSISTRSRRTLAKVFDEYSTVDKGFDKTLIPVRLLAYGDENLVSRSQAKRLLNRLDKFKVVVLDFRGVQTIGQAFADEIFRVFAKHHSEIKIIPNGANERVTRAISAAKNTTT